LATGGVVGMQMDGQGKILPEGPDQDPGSGCPEQAGHIFYAKYVHTGRDQLFGFTQVIIKGVEPLGRAREVAGITNRPFGNLASFEDRSDGRDHLVDVVESIKNPEYIDPRTGRFLDER
jgi:hypothetical protein